MLFMMLTLTLACMGFDAHARQSDMPAPEENSEAEISVFFAPSSTKINPLIAGNRKALNRIDSLMSVLGNDPSWVVNRVRITGSASPEGSETFNNLLSKRRAEAISPYFAPLTDRVPANYEYRGADWNGLRRLVVNTAGVPDSAAVLRILDSGQPNRLSRLRQLSGGTTYRWLLDTLFPQLRVSTVVVSLHHETAPDTIIERPYIELVPLVYIEPDADGEDVQPASVPEPVDDSYSRRLYIKTNAVGWAMAITNIAFEIDVVPHMSVTLPLYYSAWEYGTHKVKFRTCAFQPEVRGWLRPDNMGLFGGVHFGVAQYNMAIGGKHRYQDHDGHTPALGGGLSVGYRCMLGKSGRWMMEFTAGAGAYRLHYDAFDNSSVSFGQKLYERRKTFVGIDNVGVTFIYSLPLRRKGGRL